MINMLIIGLSIVIMYIVHHICKLMDSHQKLVEVVEILNTEVEELQNDIYDIIETMYKNGVEAGLPEVSDEE